MKQICVEGDTATGTCYSWHVGTLWTPRAVVGVAVGSEDRLTIDGIKVIVENDIVNFNCGHTGLCKPSPSVSTIYGKIPVLDGDPVLTGTGNIVAVIHASQQRVATN